MEKEIKHRNTTVNFDKVITLRIDSKTIEDFKKICGKGYQSKIRNLITNYVKSMEN